MRIFVYPTEGGIPTFDVLHQAFTVLRTSGVFSARIGGFIDGQGVMLIDVTEKPRALLALTRAGLRAVRD
jgi:hypothetical protein